MSSINYKKLGIPPFPGHTAKPVGGKSSAIEAEIAVQRCKLDKTKQECNALNKIYKAWVLDVEPLNQFSITLGNSQIGKKILERYYKSEEGADEGDRKWGDVIINAPRKPKKCIVDCGCGLTSLTMVLRYLQYDNETLYDKIVKSLNEAKDSKFAPLLMDGVSWNPSKKGKETIYKYWHPVWVLWWIRKQYGITREPKTWRLFENRMQTPLGILWFERFKKFAEMESKAIKDSKEAAKAVRESNVPEPLRNLGLKMDFELGGSSLYKKPEAQKKIKESLQKGFPVIIEYPGHFSLIIGYIENSAGGKTGTKLWWVVNDPGWGSLQYAVDAANPGGYWKEFKEKKIKTPKNIKVAKSEYPTEEKARNYLWTKWKYHVESVNESSDKKFFQCVVPGEWRTFQWVRYFILNTEKTVKIKTINIKLAGNPNAPIPAQPKTTPDNP